MTAIQTHAYQLGDALRVQIASHQHQIAPLPNGPEKHAFALILSQLQVCQMALSGLEKGQASVGITAAPTSAPSPTTKTS